MLAPQFGQRVRAESAHFTASEFIGAGGGTIETAKDIHQCRLARTGLADNGDQFALMDIDADVKPSAEVQVDVVPAPDQP